MINRWPVYRLKDFWRAEHIRIIIIVLIGLAIASAGLVLQQVKTERALLLAEQELEGVKHDQLLQAAARLRELIATIATYETEGVDTAVVESQLEAIKTTLFTNADPTKAISLIETAETTLEQLHDEKLANDQLIANQGTLDGTVREGDSLVSGVSVAVFTGSTQIAKASTGSDGRYSLSAAAGKYTLVASKSGFATLRQYNVEITAKQTATTNLNLTRAATTTTTSGGSSTANSSYVRKTISTSRGDFLVDLMTLNLASGSIKVVADTANDNDCTDQCPTKSLASYVSGLGGFAGINGTYFCPADYASCAGKTGSFFWKIKNGRIGKMINANNGLGEIDPFISFSSSGSPTYYSRYSNASTSVYSGINSWPRLIEGGSNVLDEGQLDSKQLSTKSNRGSLGLKGQTLYAVIAKSATVPDLAAVMQAIGVDSALNIDGGGSSAMYYNGAYRVGPGRSLPNALIFVGG